MAIRPQKTEDEAPGAPEWMVTFSDCMTLLLTFFVLLLSFSSFDDKVFPRMESAFAEGLSSVGLSYGARKTAFNLAPKITHDQDVNAGSEQPVPDGQYESTPPTDLDFADFENRKVFLIPSDKIFLGRGSRISPGGRQLLGDLASLLEVVPNRVIVGEYALEDDGTSPGRLGLTRAWNATQLIIGHSNLDRLRFSISSAPTMDAHSVRHSGLLTANPKTQRVVEIVILDRSVYH